MWCYCNIRILAALKFAERILLNTRIDKYPAPVISLCPGHPLKSRGAGGVWGDRGIGGFVC